MAEPALLVALDDADPNVRAASAWALSRLDHGVREATIERMISLLTDPVDEVKSAATLALGEMELPSHLAAQLGQLTAHPHVETRRAAALALVSTSAPAAADRLLAALQDGDAQVRQSALAALAELGDQRVVPLLKERLRADSVSGVRSEAAFRLGKLGDGTDVGELKKVAKEDSSTIVRRWAEWATEQLTLTRGSGSTP
jgi:HEAT repeat protein